MKTARSRSLPEILNTASTLAQCKQMVLILTVGFCDCEGDDFCFL